MGSSTTAKRRAKPQPQSKEIKKPLSTEREPTHEKPQQRSKTAGKQGGRESPGRKGPRRRRMEGVVGTVTVSFLIMLLIALLVFIRDNNIINGGGGGGSHDNAPVQPPPPPSPAPTVAPATTTPFTTMGTYELIKTIPHDTSAFTQGLVTIQDNDGNLRLYEGTGMYGDSELRILNLNGTVLARHALPSQYFGEGIAHFPVRPEQDVTAGANNKNSHDTNSFASYGLLQLTWRESTLFEYRLPLDNNKMVELTPPIANASFTSTNNNEGWGITYDPIGQVFYMTDGSANVHVWDRTMRRETRKFTVTYQFPRHSAPIRLVYLNELEWDPVTQTILANVLGQDVIVRIDPTTGFATTIYDFASIFPASTRSRSADVFNGIALSYDLHRYYNHSSTTDMNNNGNQQPIDSQHYWVTGKWWPSMYYVKLIDGTN